MAVRKAKATALAWVLGVAMAGGVQGATYDLGTVTAAGVTREVPVSPPTNLNDRFDFRIGDAGDGYTGPYKVGFEFKVGLNFSVSNLALTLFGSDGRAFGDAFGFADALPSGTYYTTVTGQAQGSAAGSYKFSISGSPSPVPLPPAVWLLAAGLAGLVGIARRKNSSVGGRTAAE